MKKAFLGFVVVTLCYLFKPCYSQSFYEVKWTGHDLIGYTGFLIFNGDNDALMRVSFTDKGVYKVAEYKCTGKYFKSSSGTNYYEINGKDAKIVYRADNSTNGYSADNFLFADLDSQHHFKHLYAYDEQDVKKSNFADLMSPAVWKSLNPKTDFSEKYINIFYGKAEHNYSALMSLTNTEVSHSVSNTKMYLVIVANTLDNSIGNGCDVDKRKLVNEVHEIATALNIDVEDHIISGTDFGSKNVLNAISALTPSSNDIVLFFYRGHGFRWNDQTSSWPSMSMRYSNYQPFESLSLEDVYSKVTAKGARLNMVFGDLCNSNIGINQVTNQGTNSMQSSFFPDIDKLKKLFLQSKGSFMSVAASPGEVSWTSSYDGGFFTSSFFESLHAEVGKFTGAGSWKNIILTTINKAQYKSQYACTTCSVQHGEYYFSSDFSN